MNKLEMEELGRIAGRLEGREFIDAFQPSTKPNQWCLKFAGKDVDVLLHPGEYDPRERVLDEIRRQLSGAR